VVAAWFAATNLRNSKTGRAFFAVRGSEIAAVSLGIDVNRYKLLAFAISGALAGIAGNLMLIDLGSATPFSFQFTVSFFYLAIAVVGGIASLGGGLASAILFATLDELFFRVKALGDLREIVPVALLLIVLLTYPGGLGALGTSISTRVGRWYRTLRRRLKTPTPDVLCGTVPAGGLKLIVGTICEKAGFAVFGVLNTPEPLLAKNCASTVVVVTVWIGVTHEIVLVFDVSGVPRYVAVPCAVSSPRFAPRYVKVADPLASVGASALVAFTPATARCTARPAIGTPFVSFAVTVSCCDVPVTFGPAFAGASTRVAPAPDEVTLVVNLADTGP